MKKQIIIVLLTALGISFGLQAQTYIPGNFSGSLDVTPTGGVNYTIPLELPAGIGNIQPQISISYNSQSKDGIMGKGFSVSGISSVTRRKNTLFHEGSVTPVSYSSSDNYSLDGNTLIISGASEYKTEVNSASRIKIHNFDASSAYFTVETKEGLIYEYGNTSDSKLFAQGAYNDRVAVWMLNKVSDRLGRYYTYTYEKDDANGEIRIKQIDYTGTASSSPFYSVKFNYTTRYYDVNLSYISGSKFRESKLLTNIQVTYGNTVLRKYDMQYESFDNTYLLTKISVIGQNNEALQPIELTWYKNKDFKQNEVKYDQTSYLNKAIIAIGDFNGDGRSDFVATPMAGAGWTGWRLFLANADGNGFTYTSSGTIVEGLERVIPGDYNGDGICDFIAHRHLGGSNVVYAARTGTSYEDRLNVQEGFEWNLNPGGTKGDGAQISFMNTNDSSKLKKKRPANLADGLPAENKPAGAKAVNYDNYFVYYGTGNGFTYTAPAIATITRPHNIKVSDFNGDGAMDLFVYYTSKSTMLPDYEVKVSEYANGTLTALNHTYSGNLPVSDHWGRVEVWDFNGDGQAEIMNLHDDGYNYFANDGGRISKLRDDSFPGKNHKVKFGDFNGDGKTDMLVTGYPGIEWSEWQTHLSTGTGFERFFFPRKFETHSKEIFVCDLNGDGADDFFAVDNTASSMIPLKYYLGFNNGKNFNEFTGVQVYAFDKWRFYPIDSRGDGRFGFVVTSGTGSWSGYQLYMPPADFTNLLHTIKDSHGNLTTITYKNMTDPSVYSKTKQPGGSAAVEGFDCLSFTAPSYKLVSNIRSSNGVGGYRDMAYTFENAKIFKRGRGFLGFTKVIRTDVDNAVQSTVTQEFCETYYHPATKQVEEKKTTTGRIITLTDYTNTFSESRRVFSFQPTQVVLKKYEPTNNYVVKSATTTYVYDAYSNPTSEITVYGNGDKTEIASTYGNNTTSWLIGQLTKKVTKKTIGGVSQTNTVEYAYHANGALASETIEPGNPAFEITTSYTYDGHGNVTEKKSTANGQVRKEEYSYSDARFLSAYTDPKGNVTSYVFSPENGLKRSETSYGIVKTYTYDSFGNTKTSSGNYGESVTNNWFWTDGSPANSVYRREETYADGQVLKTWYDCLGREIQKEEKNFAGTAVTIKKTYNALGQLVSVTEPYFTSPEVSKTFGYDAYGRITSEVTPLGTISYSYGSNSAGERIAVTDKTRGDSFTSTKTYDLSGKLKTVAETGGETISYTYGPGEKPVKIQVGTVTWEMTYDLLGRQTRLKDPNAGTIDYTYNVWGELLSKTDARNLAETYTYHADGRINTYKRGTEVFTYSYYTDTNRPKDQVKKVYNSAGTATQYGYDAYGRNNEVIQTVGTEKNLKFQYIYNSKNQLEQLVYPGGKTLKYEYAFGDLKKMTWVPSSVVVWEKLSQNSKGQLLSARSANGMINDYQYTAAGIPTSIKSLSGTTAMLQINYPAAQIDSRGNIKQRKDDYRGLSETFTYDNLNRLSASVSSVTYTTNGNITHKGGVGSYTYGSSRPHAVTSLTDVQDGYMNDNFTVTYNSVNLPSELAISSTHKYTLTYGPENQRVKSVYTKPGATVQTKYYMGPYEEVVRGSAVQKNYYMYAGNEMVAVYTEGHPQLAAGLYCFHNDHLGSPWLITNASHGEVQRLSYDAWGRRRNAADWNSYAGLPDMKFDRGYCGHEHLEMFGLINMNARLYDPILGRFLSADPYVQQADFSQAYNRYTYALNNPLKYTDPNGEFIFTALLGPLGAVLDGICWGAAIGAATSTAAYVISGSISGNWGNYGNALLMGALGGALGGGFSALGSSFLGSFGNSFGYGLLSSTASGVMTNAIYGNSLTFSNVAGAVAGGLVGAVLPRYNGLSGGAFKNAAAEIGINVGRGATTGLASGLTIAAISGDKEAIWQNAVGGAINSASSSLLTIGVFGPGYKYDDSFIPHDKDRPVHRSGGLASLLYTYQGISWGRTAYSGPDASGTIPIHESYHYFQQKDLGFAGFYGRTIIEYVKAFLQTGDWTKVYSIPNTLEAEAEDMENKYEQSLFKKN